MKGFQNRWFWATCLLLLTWIVLLPITYAAPTKLEIVWMGWPKNLVGQLIDDFEKQHPEIKVDMQLIPFGQLFQTLEVRLQSGGKPDVYIVDGPLTASYATRRYLLPMNKYFKQAELKNWLPASLQAGTYRGKLYTIPYTTSSVGLYYNKDIFKKYGVPLPSSQPKDRLTWEQVAEIAKKLTVDENKDGQIDIWGLVIEQVDRPYQLLPLAQSKGAKAISRNGLKTKGYLTSPKFVAAATYYWKLFNEWKVSPQGLNDSAKSREYFGNGNAAMMLGAEWNINRLAGFKELNFGLAPHPYFQGGKAVTPTGSWHVGVNAKTANKDAAVAFVKFITGRDAEAKWFKLFGHAPSRADVYGSVAKFNDPMWQLFFDELKNTAVVRPATPGYLEYELILRESFNSIHYGANPRQTLENAANRIDRELAKYK